MADGTTRHVVDDESFYDATDKSILSSPSIQVATTASTSFDTPGSTFSPHTYSPQAAPPAAPPPPPPPSADGKQRAYEEQFNPETSLPPTAPGVNHYGSPEYQQQNQQPLIGNYGSENQRHMEHPLAAVALSPPSHNDENGNIPEELPPVIPTLEKAGAASIYHSANMMASTSQQPQQQNSVLMMQEEGSVASSQLQSVNLNSDATTAENQGTRTVRMAIPESQDDVLRQPRSNDSNSYHQQLSYPQRNGTTGESAFVVHYEDGADEEQAGLVSQPPAASGDASVAPNVGLTNSYDYALWGMAPHELLRFLQQADSVASVASVVVASLSWLGKLMFLQLDKVVLLAYLAALSLALLIVDVMAIVTPEQQRLIPNNMMGRIRDQLGFLFHPWGKAFFVLLLTTMCWGIGGIFLSVIGSVYFVASLGWFYAAFAYQTDVPRLMGSIDETHRAETRRRNGRSLSFSISSWSAFVNGGGAAVASAGESLSSASWTGLLSGGGQRQEEGAAASERTSLIPGGGSE